MEIFVQKRVRKQKAAEQNGGWYTRTHLMNKESWSKPGPKAASSSVN